LSVPGWHTVSFDISLSLFNRVEFHCSCCAARCEILFTCSGLNYCSTSVWNCHVPKKSCALSENRPINSALCLRSLSYSQ
jgi:hypothetical protein